MMTLSWITLAVLSAAVMGVISIFDAHMIQRRMPSWQSFLLGISIYTFIYTIVLFFIIPVPTGVGAAGWARPLTGTRAPAIPAMNRRRSIIARPFLWKRCDRDAARLE